MSIERNRLGFDGEISFVCDECDKGHDTDCIDFTAARASLKDAGWLTRKDGLEWLHFCCFTCEGKWKHG